MTLAELIASARADVDDAAATYLCSDTRFKEFANEAEEQAARRGRLLLDSSTAAICQLAVTANTEFVDLDERIIFVRRIRVLRSEMENFEQDYLNIIKRHFLH